MTSSEIQPEFDIDDSVSSDNSSEAENEPTMLHPSSSPALFEITSSLSEIGETETSTVNGKSTPWLDYLTFSSNIEMAQNFTSTSTTDATSVVLVGEIQPTHGERKAKRGILEGELMTVPSSDSERSRVLTSVPDWFCDISAKPTSRELS